MPVDKITYHDNGNARTFEGPGAVTVFQMAVIASALRLYAKTGMRANRAYTPKAMIGAAAQLTGLKFKARDYIEAAEALEAKVQSEKERISANV